MQQNETIIDCLCEATYVNLAPAQVILSILTPS